MWQNRDGRVEHCTGNPAETGQVALLLGFNGEIPYPDISTKAKAQEFIGLDMKKFREEKALFLKEVIPVWKAAAAERESSWN